VKRQDRVNARVRYIEGDFTEEEKVRWEEQFTTVPEPLTEQEKAQFLSNSKGISISSDAFFPFRDSIDHASKLGVSVSTSTIALFLPKINTLGISW
jgi:phosphoribosylaminoimidazolecarboxamide formyltransferase/IMP cyclohydrolase